jgi:hypothetical protein
MTVSGIPARKQSIISRKGAAAMRRLFSFNRAGVATKRNA